MDTHLSMKALAPVVAISALLGGCGGASHADYSRVNAVVAELQLSSVGTVSSCTHGQVSGFGAGATCQVVVAGATAPAGVGRALTDHGFQRSGESTFVRGSGNDYVQAVVSPLRKGSTYTDVASQRQTAADDGALVTVSVHL